MTDSLTSSPKRTTLLIWMIISQVITLGSLLIWLLAAGLSVMAFDSGESTEAWAFVIAVWSYPIIPIALVIGAWIAYRKQRNMLAAVLSGISFTPPILFYLFIWITSLMGP